MISHPISSPDAAFEGLRRRMVEEQLPPHQIRDARVREAMARVPRHLFVPPRLTAYAYEDRTLPIGYGQTISQPLMVAIMLQAAELRGDERVLEVGAGSGYQAALLGALAREVIAIEIVPELAEGARRALAASGATNVTVVTANGSIGYEHGAPYDAILVAAGAPSAPPPLLEQLAEGGRLIIPIGPRSGLEVLQRIRRYGDRWEAEALDVCAFVPLVGAYGRDVD